MKVSHNWLQEYIVEELPSPEKLAELITFHAWEIDEQNKLPNGDTVYDLKILPDRAHDCLGHYGIARELAALLGYILKPLATLDTESEVGKGGISVAIQSPLCRRYMARVIRGVKIGKSPEWLKQKLIAIGQRSVNNVVDATNYVQFMLGQPTHVFDLDKIQQAHNGRKFIEINETVGEKQMTLLDGKEITLRSGTLVISDTGSILDLGQRVLAIAGVKGGNVAEVDTNTTDIVLEVANFDPTSVRKTARALGIVTDASKRFENEPSPELCTYAMRLLTDTIVGVAGGVPESVVDQYPVKQIELVVECTVEYIASRLGMNVTGADIANTLQARGFAYVERGGVFSITVPWWRLDITGPHDIMEEVGKQTGYERIEPKLPSAQSLHVQAGSESRVQSWNPEYYWMQRIRQFLLERGFSEVMTYTFVNTGDVEVLASTSDKSFLRTNLSDVFTEGLEKNYRNRDLLGLDEIKQFEIGKIFRGTEELLSLAVGIKRAKQKGITDELQAIVNEIEAEVIPQHHSGDEEVFPRPVITENTLEISLEILVKKVPQGNLMETLHLTPHNLNPFQSWSSYPFIPRDIAVWVPENIDPNTLVTIYKKHGGDLLVREPRLFDQFSKDGLTSYAHRLVFQSYEKTLTDAEIQPIMSTITAELASSGWEVR